MTPLRLTVLMSPTGKARARVVRRGDKVHSFTPDKTVSAEKLIRETWQAEGRVRLPDGLIHLHVLALFSRPVSHFLRGGGLSAAGRRAVPGPRIDGDNVLKLVCDALNKHAWEDDRFIVEMNIIKAFAYDNVPSLGIWARTFEEFGAAEAAA